jgi:hypothetical protein
MAGPRTCILAIALAALSPGRGDSQAAATSDSAAVVALLRDLAATARSGSLKLAELRGLPLESARTYSLKTPVPDTWTCVVRIDPSLVTVRCDIPATLVESAEKYERHARLLHEAIGSRGWGREKLTEDDIVRSGSERAVSYDFRRNRRLIALVNLSMRAAIENPRVSATADRWIILTVRGYASSGA